MHWTGAKWEKFNTYTFDSARVIAREASIELKQAGKAKAATIAYSNRVVAAIEGLARKNVAHLSRKDEFDTDNWLLNSVHLLAARVVASAV